MVNNLIFHRVRSNEILILEMQRTRYVENLRITKFFVCIDNYFLILKLANQVHDNIIYIYIITRFLEGYIQYAKINELVA